ncbi:MAG: hypothetical protein L0G70_02165 [Rubrobacter sp.]|nr:hypothetical protein [Rubrobacter sp.]
MRERSRSFSFARRRTIGEARNWPFACPSELLAGAAGCGAAASPLSSVLVVAVAALAPPESPLASASPPLAAAPLLALAP